MENKKIILASYVLVSGVVWFYMRSIFQYAYVNFYQVRRLGGIDVIRDALPIFVGLVAFVILLKHKKVNVFMDEVVSEIKKVTWPGREDVVRSTTVVIGCILVASVILAGFDVVWGFIISKIL